jgi:hypothetical protein
MTSAQQALVVPTEAELRADTIEATTTAITNNEKALNSLCKSL